MNGIESYLSRYASIRNILILFSLIVVINVFLFPVYMPSGESTRPLDIMFGYSTEEAYSMICQYGEEGRRSYAKGLLRLDYIYPVIYSLFLGFSIFRLYRNVLPALLPVAILVSDYIENTGILVMLHSWPEELSLLAGFVGIVTIIKWILVCIAALVIISGLVLRVRLRWQGG